MRFATLVALAVVVSSTPGLAAPAPYTYVFLDRPFSRPTKYTSSLHRPSPDAHHAHPKRDIATTDVNNIQFDERAFKIPASVTTWFQNLGNIASIGAGGAAIVGAFDGSSNITKREWNTAIDGIGLERPPIDSSVTQFDERAFKIPASVTTWLKDLGNVASIGAGGAAIVGAFDGSSNSTLKREWNTAIDGIGLERPPVDSSVTQFDERAFKIPASVTTWLKDLGNVASIGASGAAIVGALDGSNNSTKREFVGVDLTIPLDEVTPQFEDRSVSSGEVSGLESVLEELAGVASTGGAIASVFSAFEGSSNSTKRDLGISDITSFLGGPRPVITSPQHSSAPPMVASKKRSIPADAESILQQITAVVEGAIGGSDSTSASTKRFTSAGGVLGLTDIITPEQLQQILAHLNATRMTDLD